MPLDNGPVPRTANIIIRFDEKPLSERLSQDLGCKDVKEYKKLCEGFELASPTYQTSMRALLQKRSENSDKVKRSSIYHQFLWLSSVRNYKERTRDTSGGLSLETMRNVQKKWSNSMQLYIHTRKQLPPDHEAMLNTKIDMRGTASLCIPIRAFFGLALLVVIFLLSCLIYFYCIPLTFKRHHRL